MEQFWLTCWYQGRRWLWLLWPLSKVFEWVAKRRRARQMAEAPDISVPLIVVGNITLGGTGKTPLILALARYLAAQGHRPGIVSRGYGGRAPHYPFRVEVDSLAEHCGDEPLQMARDSGVSVVVDRDRPAAAQLLIREHQCDVILSDDGLQHYRLQRDLELVVLDGTRGLGNGLCLPAGPLREPPRRLTEVDWVVINGADYRPLSSLALKNPWLSVSVEPQGWVHVATGEQRPLKPFPFSLDETVRAIAGIGNPDRFFATLRELGIKAETQAFPDHHHYRRQDIETDVGQTVLMTAKDAVKCQSIADNGWWALQVAMAVPEPLKRDLDRLMNSQTPLERENP